MFLVGEDIRLMRKRGSSGFNWNGSDKYLQQGEAYLDRHMAVRSPAQPPVHASAS